MISRLKVINVKEGFSAAAAGIRVGDVLEKYNDIELTSEAALTRAAELANGNSFVLTVSTPNGLVEKTLPIGRLGIDVLEIVFDRSDYFIELEFERKVDSVVVTTTPSIDGNRISRYLGVISAEVVCGVGLFSEFFASLTDTFGGRSGKLQSHLLGARRDCMSELAKQAAGLGANAIVGIDLDYSEISGQGKSMLFVVATGTAVVIEPIA